MREAWARCRTQDSALGTGTSTGSMAWTGLQQALGPWEGTAMEVPPPPIPRPVGPRAALQGRGRGQGRNGVENQVWIRDGMGCHPPSISLQKGLWVVLTWSLGLLPRSLLSSVSGSPPEPVSGSPPHPTPQPRSYSLSLQGVCRDGRWRRRPNQTFPSPSSLHAQTITGPCRPGVPSGAACAASSQHGVGVLSAWGPVNVERE